MQLESELLNHLPEELVTLADRTNAFGVVQAPFVGRTKKKRFLLISERFDNAQMVVMHVEEIKQF